MAYDHSSTSSTPLPPEIVDAAKGVIARYLEEHDSSTFVQLAKVLREQRASGNIDISNSQIKIAIEQLAMNGAISRHENEYSLPGVVNETGPDYTRPLMVQVNKFLEVVYDEQASRARVIVDGKPFLHCSFIVADIASTNHDIQSIDDLAQYQDARILEGRNVREYLTPAEEVFAHASNLQAWAEYGYDTRLLHSNIAFPLLKELASAGDDIAARVLPAEVDARLRDGNTDTRNFIIEQYGEMLNNDSIKFLANDVVNLLVVLRLLTTRIDVLTKEKILLYVNAFLPDLSNDARENLLQILMTDYVDPDMEKFLKESGMQLEDWEKKCLGCIEVIPDSVIEVLLDVILHHSRTDFGIILLICYRKSLPVLVLEQLTRDEDPGIRGLIASRPDLPEEIVSIFVNEEQNDEVLRYLYNNESETVCWHLMCQATPKFRNDRRFWNVFSTLAYSADTSIRLNIADQPDISRDILDHLAHDHDPTVSTIAKAQFEKKYPYSSKSSPDIREMRALEDLQRHFDDSLRPIQECQPGNFAENTWDPFIFEIMDGHVTKIGIRHTRKDSRDPSTEDYRGLHLRQLRHLPDSIGDLAFLEVLDLEENALTELPDSIGNLSRLTSLNLFGNKLKSFPENLENLVMLDKLVLSHNGLEEFPEAITRISSLQVLRINDNQIRSIPASIGNLTNLKELNISNNPITSLPDEIDNLQALEELYAMNCRLTVIPESIVTMSALRRLDLGGNPVRESIPNSISSLEWFKSHDSTLNTLRKKD